MSKRGLRTESLDSATLGGGDTLGGPSVADPTTAPHVAGPVKATGDLPLIGVKRPTLLLQPLKDKKFREGSGPPGVNLSEIIRKNKIENLTLQHVYPLLMNLDATRSMHRLWEQAYTVELGAELGRRHAPRSGDFTAEEWIADHILGLDSNERINFMRTLPAPSYLAIPAEAIEPVMTEILARTELYTDHMTRLGFNPETCTNQILKAGVLKYIGIEIGLLVSQGVPNPITSIINDPTTTVRNVADWLPLHANIIHAAGYLYCQGTAHTNWAIRILPAPCPTCQTRSALCTDVFCRSWSMVFASLTYVLKGEVRLPPPVAASNNNRHYHPRTGDISGGNRNQQNRREENRSHHQQQRFQGGGSNNRGPPQSRGDGRDRPNNPSNNNPKSLNNNSIGIQNGNRRDTGTNSGQNQGRGTASLAGPTNNSSSSALRAPPICINYQKGICNDPNCPRRHEIQAV